MKCGPTKKRMFKSHEAAVARGVEILSKGEGPARHWQGFRAYKCIYCGGWHLTKQI